MKIAFEKEGAAAILAPSKVKNESLPAAVAIITISASISLSPKVRRQRLPGLKVIHLKESKHLNWYFNTK
jgi:hypothetical protein